LLKSLTGESGRMGGTKKKPGELVGGLSMAWSSKTGQVPKPLAKINWLTMSGTGAQSSERSATEGKIKSV